MMMSRRDQGPLVFVFIAWIATLCFTKNDTILFADAREITAGPDVWEIPQPNQTMPSQTVTVGDTIIFEWNADKNVYIYTNDECIEEGKRLVGYTSPASYTFTENDVGEMYFSSLVFGQCQAGLLMVVTVLPCEDGNEDCVTPRPGSLDDADNPNDDPNGNPDTLSSSNLMYLSQSATWSLLLLAFYGTLVAALA